MTDTHPPETDPQTRPDPDRWRSRPNPHLHVGPTAHPCPTCGALVGKPCLDRWGDEQDGFHRTRALRSRATKAAATPDPTPARPGRAARGPAMSEAELGREVAKLARRGGYRINHHRRSRRADGRWETATTIKGWPDCEFIGPRILWRELKGTGGVLSPDQKLVLGQISAAGGDAKCWWPDALYSGEIERTLCGHLTDG